MVAILSRTMNFFLGRDMMRRKTYSETTAQEKLTAEVRGIINRCYQRAA